MKTKPKHTCDNFDMSEDRESKSCKACYPDETQINSMEDLNELPVIAEENKMKHIEEWIEERIYGECKEDEKYALAFFFLKGMDAVSNFTIEPIMKDHKLFCIYEGQTYRVTGCSTMGDIWLHADFEKDSGYLHRVDVTKCSQWSKEV